MVGEEGQGLPCPINVVAAKVGLSTPQAEKENPERKSHLFVYVFATDDGLCKVGVSHDPIQRKTALERASGRPLVLFIAYRSEAARRLERLAHERLADCRVQGEWFRCDAMAVVRAIEGVAQKLGARAEPRQLGVERGAEGLTFLLKPAEDGVEEPSLANVALWRLLRLGLAPKLSFVQAVHP